MITRCRSTFGAAVLLLALISCSDDDSPTGGGSTADTTPPAIASVSPVDAFHVDVTFSEPVTKSTATYIGHYVTDTMAMAAVSLQDDQKTVTVTSQGSMAGLDINLTVNGVSDLHGNSIGTPVVKAFTGSDTPDTTPPQVISVWPSPGAVDVPIGAPLIIRLSDVVQG
ncbi:MAG TPA: Ig-like domain-containing protein, partial [Pirellulaceae bacterium]